MHKIFHPTLQSSRELGKLFQHGEPIFHQGEVANCIYVVQQGKVESFLETAEGSIPLSEYRTGEVFGEIALFAEKARFTTARAVGETRVLRIDEKTFIAKLHQDPSLAYRMIKKMAQQIYELDHQLMNREIDQRRTQEEDSGPTSVAKAGEMLDVEVKRAKRLRQGLAYVILDLDESKKIQMQYGDVGWRQVNDAIAENVRAILRRTDIIGRDGNGRFQVIMLEGDGPSAVKVLENLRKTFARMVHQIGKAEFTATISCGVAIYPEHKDTEDLRAAAQAALKRAKMEGRDKIVLAPPAIGKKS